MRASCAGHGMITSDPASCHLASDKLSLNQCIQNLGTWIQLNSYFISGWNVWLILINDPSKKCPWGYSKALKTTHANVGLEKDPCKIPMTYLKQSDHFSKPLGIILVSQSKAAWNCQPKKKLFSQSQVLNVVSNHFFTLWASHDPFACLYVFSHVFSALQPGSSLTSSVSPVALSMEYFSLSEVAEKRPGRWKFWLLPKKAVGRTVLYILQLIISVTDMVSGLGPNPLI